MKVDAIINDRTATVELVSREDNKFNIKIDDKIYDVDILFTPNGSYSILHNHRSWELETAKANEFNTFNIYKYGQSIKVEIEDALSKYRKNKQTGSHDGQNNIIAPMPGKIVKVLVEEGEPISAGDTVLIISAMKMESEFKSPVDGIVKKVHIKDNDIVNGDQLLVEIEAIEEIEE